MTARRSTLAENYAPDRLRNLARGPIAPTLAERVYPDGGRGPPAGWVDHRRSGQ
jgi:hypothetical protein